MATPRFLTLTDVGEILSISSAQTYALVRSGALALGSGGRGELKLNAIQRARVGRRAKKPP